MDISIIILLITLFYVTLCVYRTCIHPLSKFPGPFISSVSYLPYLWKNCIRGIWVRDISTLHRKYGSIVRIGPNHLSIDGALAWPGVFAHRPGKPEYSKQKNFYGPEGEFSMIGAPFNMHRYQRRKLSRAFSESALTHHESVISQHVDELMQQMMVFCSQNQSVNIVEWLKFAIFDIIGDLTFSESLQCINKGEYHPLAAMMSTAIRGHSLRRVFLDLPIPDIPACILNNLPFFKKFVKIQDWAWEKASARIKSGLVGKNDHADFLDYLLENTPEDDHVMTEREILANSFLFFLAGSDTTATALSGLFFYLGQNRQVYDTLLEELREKFPTESDINAHSCASLPFLSACIEETLRLYPPSPEMPPRISPGDVIEGHDIPSGTYISVFSTSTFRNPDHFQDPDHFCPHRWLSPDHPLYKPKFRRDNRFVCKPFSYGRRDCIGKILAYAEIRLILVRLLHRFDFELISGQDDWQSKQRMFMVWEKLPLNILFRPRGTV